MPFSPAIAASASSGRLKLMNPFLKVKDINTLN